MADNDRFKIVKGSCDNNEEDECAGYPNCQGCAGKIGKTRAEYEGIISQIISDFTSSEYGIALAKAVVDRLFGEGL